VLFVRKGFTVKWDTWYAGPEQAILAP